MIERLMKVTISGETFVATVKTRVMEISELETSADIEMIFNPEDAERLQAACTRWNEERSGITFGNIEEES